MIRDKEQNYKSGFQGNGAAIFPVLDICHNTVDWIMIIILLIVNCGFNQWKAWGKMAIWGKNMITMVWNSYAPILDCEQKKDFNLIFFFFFFIVLVLHKFPFYH